MDKFPRFSRALFVSCVYPADFEKAVFGVYLRMRTFLQALREMTEALDILFISDRIDGDIETATQEISRSILKDWGIEADLFLVKVPNAPNGERWIDHYLQPALSLRRNADYAGLDGAAVLHAVEACLARKPDIFFAHRLQAAMPFFRLREKVAPPMFFDLDDVEHRKLFRTLLVPPHYPGKIPYALRALPIMAGERRAARTAARTFVCSEADRKYLENWLGFPRVAVIQNSIEIPAQVQPLQAARRMIFLGTYTYGPNIVGAEFLITKVWPIVRDAVPDAELVIAGNRPDRIPSHRHPPPGVRFAGFVEDLARMYSETRLVCCPIQSGGGTRIKIIEAAAHARPVVSTTIGAEGLQFRNESEIILADTPELFARACIRLLEDEDLAARIGMAGRARAQAAYSRSATIGAIKCEIFAGIDDAAGQRR